MQIENLTNVQALAFIGGVILFAILLYRFIPSGEQKPVVHKYSESEITAYDRELPKYFLAAALALMLGGFHTLIKNLPGFWEWLWRAGYGGHLFRDLSNSHIVIVGGGTVMLTALTWYVLPRFTRRPLYSELLASASFWLTIVGVFSFYITWMVLGLIEGRMVTLGLDYESAKAVLGNWHRIPTAVTSSIMGFGYWSYVLNAFLTAFTAPRKSGKPFGYLTKFSLVSAGALFVGTVQGVIQVLPDNADWIHAAGKFGEYVDPISHAHVNLVTGMMVSLGAFLIFFGRRLGLRSGGKKVARLLFYVLVPGSLIFYLSFLFSGLVLGGAVNGYGGIQSPSLTTFFSQNIRLILMVAGSWMLAGFWIYFALLWRGVSLQDLWDSIREAEPRAFWLVSSAALFIGTLQGILQILPVTARILTTPEEIPNIHAQINMIGGVILPLIGLVYLLLPELIERVAMIRLRKLSLAGIGIGIGGYYTVTLTSGLLRYRFMGQGMDSVQAALRLGWLVPAFLVGTAIPLFIGFVAFGRALWQATREYRRVWLLSLLNLPERLNGQPSVWREHIPPAYFVAAEAIGASFGFPGIGWLLSGQGVVGIPLALTGPAAAWAFVPFLMSPYEDGPLAVYGLWPLVIYLLASASLSVSFLALTLYRPFRRRKKLNSPGD